VKILVLTSLYPPYNMGGAEKSVSLIARGLVRRGHQRQDVLDGVRVTYLPLLNVYWPFVEGVQHSKVAKLTFHTIDTLNVGMAAAVGRIVAAERPDVVLSNNVVFLSTLVWRTIHKAGIPLLHTFRDFYLLCPTSLMFRNGKPCAGQCLDCRPFAWPRRVMSRYVDGITGVSQFMIDRHLRFGLFPNALVLPPILSAVDVPPELPAREAVAPGVPMRFGYIGRVSPDKGVDLLLDGLQTADPRRWSLKIAGRGSSDYIAHLRQRCADLPVDIMGFTPSADLYRVVDVVAVPSIWEEPLPRTLLEAFAYGLPVLGSTRGGIPEVLKSGETGYLVDLDKPGDMAAAIARIIDNRDEAHAFGQAGRMLVSTRTDDAVAADYEASALKVLAWRQFRTAAAPARQTPAVRTAP
jgi:glycosyltransferase involved in cell wall biosynthesis